MRVRVKRDDPEYNAGLLPHPPIGATGTIIEGIDEYGDYEVVFDSWPQPVPKCKAWTMHHTMLAPITNLNVEDSELFECV